MDRLGLSPDRTNVTNDTIIARLHILGYTGAHLMAILLHYMKHHQQTSTASSCYGLLKLYVCMEIGEATIVPWVGD